MNADETTVACLTPPGSGAIAVVALRGPQAEAVIAELFHPASATRRPDPLLAGTVWCGRLGEGSHADEVVLVIKQNVPFLWLELHTHGGRQVVDWMIEMMANRGVTRIDSAAFLARVERAHRAEAMAQLARAATVRTAAILLDQVNGASDAAFAGSSLQAIDDALRFASLAEHLTEPWRVAIAGPPNVGKSTLMNALAGFPRSVVAPIAGTTRDAVSAVLAIDGWPVELIDTAGLRDEAAGLERAGIERARSALESADLIVWVYDARDKPPPHPDSTSVLTVANKCDQPDAHPRPIDLSISALTGMGIDELCTAISVQLVPVPPPPGAAVPVSKAQVEQLRRLRTELEGKAPFPRG